MGASLFISPVSNRIVDQYSTAGMSRRSFKGHVPRQDESLHGSRESLLLFGGEGGFFNFFWGFSSYQAVCPQYQSGIIGG